MSTETNGSSKLNQAREDAYAALRNAGLEKSSELLTEIRAGEPLSAEHQASLNAFRLSNPEAPDHPNFWLAKDEEEELLLTLTAFVTRVALGGVRPEDLLVMDAVSNLWLALRETEKDA
jgi:hypothetical protein